MTEERTRENQLRRMAAMQGFCLQKSRRRDRQALITVGGASATRTGTRPSSRTLTSMRSNAWLNLPGSKSSSSPRY